MSEIIKQQAPLILEEIKKAKNILLHCHPHPDPDSVGSVLAIKFALEQLGKKVTAIQGDNEIPEAFDFPGVETIIKKAYGEINTNEFDLFIILDSSTPNMVSFKTPVTFPESMKTIVIDHHVNNEKYGTINCVDSSYPATAQILFDLFREIGIKLNHDIALNLFMGIYTDTGAFKYGGVTPATFAAASELVSLAPDFVKTISIMENSNTKEKFIFVSLALASLKTYFSDRLAVAYVTKKQFDDHGLNGEEYSPSEISSLLRTVKNFDISICFIEFPDGKARISSRSKDSVRFDVSKLAVAFGGGGHKGAAGATIDLPLAEAIDKVVKTAEELYNF